MENFKNLFGYQQASVNPFILDEEILQMLNDLLGGYKKQVEYFVKQHRNNIKELVRDRTRFNPYLKMKAKRDLEYDNVENLSIINIKVVDDIPESIAKFLKKKPPFLIKLLLNRNSISRNIEILEGLSDNDKYLLVQNILQPDFKNSPEHFRQMAVDYRSLSVSLDKFAWELLNCFLECDGDIFGSYNLQTHDIKIFWISIALYANLRNLRIEDAVIIVLAHEMAHLFTHIGKDINGNVWPTELFLLTDKRITEGLAEYHSFEVCRAFLNKQNSLYDTILYTYASMLMDAPAIYQAWIDPWFRDDSMYHIHNMIKHKPQNSIDDLLINHLNNYFMGLKDIGEIVRSATISARTTHTPFDGFLKNK